MSKWVILTVLWILMLGCNADKTVDEILDNLVSYNPRKPPPGLQGPGSSTEVTVSMYILDLKVDDMKQEVTAQMYFRQYWTDSRLKFKDGEGKDKLLSYRDWTRIWTPDLFFVNEDQGKFHTVPFYNTFARWKSDGSMSISMRLTMTFRCNMDMTYYPHDQHKCLFHVESYAHRAEEIALLWRVKDTKYNAVEIADEIHDKNFQVIGLNYTKDMAQGSFGNYTRLVVELTVKRNPGFFVTKLYIPYIVLAIVSWLSLWIHPKFVAPRLSLLLSVLLAMFLLALDMDGYAPRVTYTKGIDVWTAFSISFVFALLLEFVFVSQTTQKEKAQELSHITTETLPLENSEKDSKFLPLKLKIFHPKYYGGGTDFHRNADHATRLIFPVLFGVFNLIYWCVYAS